MHMSNSLSQPEEPKEANAVGGNTHGPLVVARKEANAILDRLTSEQHEVLRQFAQGKTYKEVEAVVGIGKRGIEGRMERARKHLSANRNKEAIRTYNFLMNIAHRDTGAFFRLQLTEEDIEKLIRAFSMEQAAQIVGSQEFEDWRQAYISKGPEALDAKYGPGWKWAAALLVAVCVVVVVERAFSAAAPVNQVLSNQESPSP